jgi:fatty acid synthase
MFKGIARCDIGASTGLLKWEDNWTTFMDNMLQMNILQVDSRLLYVPVGIRKLTIDPVKHHQIVESFKRQGIAYSCARLQGKQHHKV